MIVYVLVMDRMPRVYPSLVPWVLRIASNMGINYRGMGGRGCNPLPIFKTSQYNPLDTLRCMHTSTLSMLTPKVMPLSSRSAPHDPDQDKRLYG